ncbi:uncharacterized protein LOC21397435 isoform X1 [Morus notabilis]|uniref:uncharacterized protein LOC21397435 isoform X1 n=1 Tax=Morus notabilis TaxID=981085 RepID=UPI000CED4804|nr:uncharacterized protein LOC21397435 isoform X1 [Morus notabilis]
MEVKLRQRPDLLLPLFQSKFEFPSCSLCLKSWAKSERLLKKHIRGKLQKWRIRIGEISKGQYSAKHYSVHVVKEGETLTSISKHYGVSIYAIAAANKNIADIDLVFEGRHLSIPLADKHILERSWSGKFKLPSKDRGSLNILNGVLSPKNFSLIYLYLVPDACPWYYQARTVGGFLVLVSLVAFCIRCIVGAFHNRASGEFRHKNVNESDVKHLRSQGGRWRSALGDAWEPERTDGDSIPDSRNHSEDQPQISFEEASHAYRKLEHDYQEFLSQCGMSKWGYWRGGSPR